MPGAAGSWRDDAGRTLLVANGDDPRLVRVVDDDAGMRRLIKAALTPMGYQVVAMASGVESLHVARVRRPMAAVLVFPLVNS